MDSIVVSVADLHARIKEIRRDGLEYVRISLFEAEPDPNPDYALPPRIDFDACKKSDTGIWVNFDSVDALPNNEELEREFNHTLLGIDPTEL